MSAKINRVVIAVKDIDKSIGKYSKLLGTTFGKTGDAIAAKFGLVAAFSWEAGVELVMPVQGTDNPGAQQFKSYLEKNGDGIVGVDFDVPAFDKVKASANETGASYLGGFELCQEDIKTDYQDRFKSFKEEIFLLDGVSMAFNVIELK